MILSAKPHHSVNYILQHSTRTRPIICSRKLSTLAANTTPTRLIPKLNQSVTRLGFGGYRVSDPATHGAALQYALKNGINLIDTGANFENGRSESLIGDILASSDVDRKDITLVTKAGYLTKDDIERLDRSTGSGGDDYAHIQGHSYHGISPRILEDQLGQSLARLKTNYIDIFMVNAPERMLLSSSSTGRDVYKQLGNSFRFLDDMVQQGTIKGYGVCSNTMASKEAVDHISLDGVLAACDKLDTNFVAVEAPFNLYEQQLLQNDAVVDALETNDIFWIGNRPLNAITPQGTIRGLYNHMMAQPKDMDDLRQAFERVTELEVDMISELPEDMDQDDLGSRFVWGQILSENLQRLGQHHFATQHYLRSQVQPKLDKDLDDFKQVYGDVPAYMEWTGVYRTAMLHLMECLVNYSYMDTLKKNNDLDRILSALVSWPNQYIQHFDEQLEAAAGGGGVQACHSPLTIKALQIYLAQQELGAIVTGMRQPQYVDDALVAMNEYQVSPLSKQQLIDLNRILV